MLRQSVFATRNIMRPALKREDDPLWWDDWQAKQAARDRAAQSLKVENWQHSRQLALLMIFRSDGAKACMDAMQPMKVSQHDFAFLRNAGFATKQLANRYHNLTLAGFAAARQCVAIVAKRHGLHLVAYDMDSWSEHKVRCTCGWHQSLNRRNNEGAFRYLQTRAERHLAEVVR